MKPLEELLNTARMFYLPLGPWNSVEGLKDLLEEVTRPDFIIVEIGSFSGVSSDLMARYCKELYCVDIWNKYPEAQAIGPEDVQLAEDMFDMVWAAHDNIRPLQGFSTDAADTFPEASVDMVYIDAIHEYENVKQDILAWLPKIRKGGWITGHDMSLEGVAKAVKELFGTDYKTYNDSSWAHQV